MKTKNLNFRSREISFRNREASLARLVGEVQILRKRVRQEETRLAAETTTVRKKAGQPDVPIRASSKFGRTSGPRLPHALQTSRGSRSDSRTSSLH